MGRTGYFNIIKCIKLDDLTRIRPCTFLDICRCTQHSRCLSFPLWGNVPSHSSQPCRRGCELLCFSQDPCLCQTCRMRPLHAFAIRNILQTTFSQEDPTSVQIEFKFVLRLRRCDVRESRESFQVQTRARMMPRHNIATSNQYRSQDSLTSLAPRKHGHGIFFFPVCQLEEEQTTSLPLWLSKASSTLVFHIFLKSSLCHPLRWTPPKEHYSRHSSQRCR